MTGKLERPGGALHFEVIDATPPWRREAPLVVFHHGIGATGDIWAEWLPALVDRFRIARFDTLGFGRSAVPVTLRRIRMCRRFRPTSLGFAFPLIIARFRSR